MLAGKQPRSPRLYNVVVPMLFWEVWQVGSVVLLVAAIESVVWGFSLGVKGFKFFRSSFFINLATTLLGYLLQGFIRFFTLIVASNIIPGGIANSPAIDGLTGNFGIGYPRPLETFAINFATSASLAFLISVLVEYCLWRRVLKLPVGPKKLFVTVLLANAVTYSLISAWILFQFFGFYLKSLDA